MTSVGDRVAALAPGCRWWMVVFDEGYGAIVYAPTVREAWRVAWHVSYFALGRKLSLRRCAARPLPPAEAPPMGTRPGWAW